jgi:hypothetical protein
MLDAILSGPLGAIITNTVGAYLANRFSKMDDTQADLRTAAEHAIQDAFEQWITAILKALEMQGFDDDELRHFFAKYQPALGKFLHDSEVVDELLQPFSATDTKYQLNTTKLEQHWQALQLPALPDGFDLAGVNRAYVQRVKKAGIVTRELRDLFMAQLAQERTGYLEDIRGVWPDFDLDNYAKRVETRYQVLDLSALTQPERDDFQKISLSAVFIPQSVREQRPPRELPKEMLERLRLQGEVKEEEVTAKLRWEELRELQGSWERAETEPVLDVLAQSENRCLVLLGDPGAGKSTLARYLLLSVLAPPADAQGSVPTWLATFQKRLPLLVELREYLVAVAGQHCECLLEYFHYQGKAQGYALNHLTLKEQLQIRPSLVIFDGLDEIFDPVQREQVTQEIIGFASEYPQARVLVTSRIVGYQGQALRAAQFQEYTLLDLDLDQIKTFARGWFNLVFQQQPEEAAFRYQRIETALQQSPAIRLLAGNPLLLTMIAIIAKHQELPRERVKLYEHAVKVLCHHWDVTRHKIVADNSLQEDDKLELLRRLAWRMQAAPGGLKGNVISKEDLQTEIENYWQQRWQKPLDEARVLARAMIDQLRERNFILCHYGSQVYGFVHRTFLEYFCAAELVYRFEKLQTLSIGQLKEEVFLAHYRDGSWHEVLRLICSMVAPKFAGELIGAIVPVRQDAYEKTEDLILAVQCLAEVSELNQIEGVARRVLEGICGWFEPGEGYRRGLQKEESFVEKALPLVESIGKNWPGREAFLPWLSELNKEVSSIEGVNVFSRMVAALWSDYEDTKQSLIALSEANPDMAFDALARSFGNQRKIQMLLQQEARHGKNGDIRRVALRALAEHYSTLPETQTLLRERAINDPESEVRKWAVGEWVLNYHNDTWQNLLSKDLIGGELHARWNWLDPKEDVIDKERVPKASEKLNLPPETIRQHYEAIAQEIPLRLSWKK